MNISGDLRYVHPGEYAALAGRGAERLREAYYEQTLAFLRDAGRGEEIDEGFRERWMQRYPAGYVEHRRAWHPEGPFGALYSTAPAAIRINRTLFVHAGIGPRHAGLSLEQINAQVSAELAAGEYRPTPEQLAQGPRLVEDEHGPLWYRELGMEPAVVRIAGDDSAEAGTGAAADEHTLLPQTQAEQEAERAAAQAAAAERARALEAHLEALLAQHDVDRIVVGHTPGFGTVVPRHGGRVLVIDSGIAPYYGGHVACLLIEGAQLFTNQDGTRVPLPERDASALPYLQRIAELEPEINNLQYLVERLQAQQESGLTPRLPPLPLPAE
jgi:hypothetical protein